MEVDLPILPSDIISFQILTRLPAKSLMRFKCVCKSWSSSLFRDPFFVKAYQNMHNSSNNDHKTTHLLLGNWDITTGHGMLFSMQFNQELGFTNSPTPPAIDLLSLLSHNLEITSSNGLICLYNYDAAVAVGIFNPCTREFTTLPVSQYASKSPSDSGRTVHYIGFSPLTNEYKVFRVDMHRTSETRRSSFMFEIFTLGSTSSFMFEIFTLGSNSWRDVQNIGLDDLDLDAEAIAYFNRRDVCIHGAIHWVVRNRKGKNIILAFDVGEESFRVIPLPQDYEHCYVGYIFEVNGCVAIFRHDLGLVTVMSICILKDYQNQVWVKERIVFPDEWQKLGRPLPVCSVHTGELLLRPDLRGYGDVHLYDMKRKSYQKTEIILPGSILTSYDESIEPLR